MRMRRAKSVSPRPSRAVSAPFGRHGERFDGAAVSLPFANLAAPRLACGGSIGHSPAMAELDIRATNAPEITVSELSNALKRAIEDRFGYVRVRGEISGYRGPHSSGHAYFSLKDANARLDAVIWRSAFLRMRIKPEEGLEVVATGKLTTFPGKSSYQIVVESLELAG